MKIKFLLIICFVLQYMQTITAQKSEITTVIIVRHAEKDSSAENQQPAEMTGQQDVKLTERGEQRAVLLADMLDKSGVSAVFSTNTTRTIETVDNYADKNGLEVYIYDDLGDLAEKILSDHRGDKILVSAHSDTIGPLMKALGADSVPHIDHDYYSGLFIVTLVPGGSVSWLHLEY